MTYSTDKCIKLLGYEYELPDEIILKIQKLVVMNKMSDCGDEFWSKCRVACVPVHLGCSGQQRIFSETANINSNLYIYNVNRGRLYLKYFANNRPRGNASGWWITPLLLRERKGIFGMGHFLQHDGMGLWQTKAEMVEVMKNHGMKFNKSKKKSDLFNIFIKNKCFAIE
tara:strand:+ start:8137 stop:8643 length:507 start_codon:yes stop_codon:yes gene_type:complete